MKSSGGVCLLFLREGCSGPSTTITTSATAHHNATSSQPCLTQSAPENMAWKKPPEMTLFMVWKGGVGRYRDFDGSFLPLKVSMGDRWSRIDRAYHQGDELPAVSLYKIGNAYFVRDGNHRVSVARYHGVAAVDAEVVEIRKHAS